MNETAVRELLVRAMAGEEPPIDPLIIGGAVGAARTTRRRQLVISIGMAAVVVPALAIGGPAFVGALGSAGSVHHAPVLAPSLRHAAHSHLSRTPGKHHAVTRRAGPGQTVAAAAGIHFFRPTLPPNIPETDPVPVTKQSIGQLLIDDMPAGARLSQIEVAMDAGNSRFIAHNAGFDAVTTSAGAGELQVYLVSQKGLALGCSRPENGSDITCMPYRLPGGVRVSEQIVTSGDGSFELVVNVSRPGVAAVALVETNQVNSGGGAITKNPPLTLASGQGHP
jgi:hypothetical protein